MRFSLEIEPLDLDMTLGCGQVFRWSRNTEGRWSGIINNYSVELWNSDGRLEGSAVPGDGRLPPMISEYLRASDDIAAIQTSLATDPVLATGIGRFSGLRIIKMDEWECLASYVLATFANIPRIKKMITTISERFGSEIIDGAYSFPSPSELRKASLDALRGCGLGYRASYLHDIAMNIDETYIRRMKQMKYEDLRRELMTMPGVGEKVADCVSLFGFGKLDAFPIDVWIERAVARLYGVKGPYKEIRRFAADRWGAYAGYAQEYLYFNERTLAKSTGCEFTRCGESSKG